ICAGDTAQITAVLTGTGPWDVSWSDGLVQSVASPVVNRSVSPTSTTTYTVTSVSDGHCSTAGTGAAEIVVGTPVDPPSITAPNGVAVGATGVAASVPGHDGSTYAWTLDGGNLASGQGTSAVTLDAGAPGTTMNLSVVETNTSCASPVSSKKVQ